MSFRALLMRLFLIVALVANGPGIAGASMHMEHLRDSAADVTYVTTVQAAVGSMAACHGATATDPAAVDHDHPEYGDKSGEASPLDDCCQAGDCCACMHHCSAALSGSALADFTVRYRQIAESFLSVRPLAVLTNLFRPPIG